MTAGLALFGDASQGAGMAVVDQRQGEEHGKHGEHRGPGARLRAFVESGRFVGVVATAVLLNAIVLGVDVHTDLPPRVRAACDLLDTAFLTFFVAEIALKLAAYRGAYFKDTWRTFDFAIVAVALLPATGAFTVLRVLRVLRMLRLVSVIGPMRRVVEALVRAVPGLTAIVGVLCVLFYMGAVLTTALYGQAHPMYFGSLQNSATTLFQLMLFDDWATVVRETEESHPGATLFFVGFTLVSGFAVLNLFIAVMVDALREEHDRLEHDELEDIEERQIRAVRDIEEIEDVVRRMDEKLDSVIASLKDRPPPPGGSPS